MSVSLRPGPVALRPQVATRPPEPTDSVELSSPSSVRPEGIAERTAEWTAGLVGSLWRLLVVGSKLPPVPVPVEPVQQRIHIAQRRRDESPQARA